MEDMGNEASRPAIEASHYIHVEFRIDPNDEHVHVQLLPEDLSYEYQSLLCEREKDEGVCPKAHGGLAPSRDTRTEDRDKEVFIAVHNGAGQDHVRTSIIPKRTLDELEQERGAWLEPSGNEPDIMKSNALFYDPNRL